MTTVLGVARDGHVWMAADSQVSICDRPMPGAVKKVLRLPAGEDGQDGEVLLGISGDGALAGLARQFLKVAATPVLGADGRFEDRDAQDFADQIAMTMTSIAREHGVVDDDHMDGMLLLGWGGRLWTMLHSQAIPHIDGVGAVGSGSDAALGAVHALLALPWEPLESVVRAVQIAIGLDLSSAAPVHVDVLPPPERSVQDQPGGGEQHGQG